MKGLRDRWNDRGPVDDPVAELDRLAARLRDVEEQLRFAESQVVAAEEAERGLQDDAEDLFSNVLAPDKFDRKRAEVTHSLTTARRQRDDLKDIVAAGRRACEAQHRAICEQQEAACDEQQRILDRDLAQAVDRVRALEALDALLAERRRSFGHGESQWLALKARYDERTQATLESRRREAELRPPPETVEQSRARQVDDLLAVRTVDNDGREVPAYVRLNDGGGPVRLSR
jgi:hypothetical protein